MPCILSDEEKHWKMSKAVGSSWITSPLKLPTHFYHNNVWLNTTPLCHWNVTGQNTTEPLKCVTRHNRPLWHCNVCDWTPHHCATEMCVTGHNTPLSHWNVCDWAQHTNVPLKCVWLNTTHHCANEMCVTGHNTPLSHWNVCDWAQHTTEPLKCVWLDTTHN
jgi:hypothetical protein